ncbi:MAG: LysM peptidoglycan-binding domain-containing protein [Christensenellaceae bacterium]|jgi:LysM repeat protein|nr:LysM peptidoglycan-binding domain-containing protein [Christensenellaceae bacterium]
MMKMETVYNNLEQKTNNILEHTQMKIDYKADVPADAKKVLSTKNTLFQNDLDVNDNEVTVFGDIISRAVFINENDKFDSNEVSNRFEAKIPLKDAKKYSGLSAVARLIDDNIIDVVLTGLSSKSIRYVSGIDGGCEIKTNATKIGSFDSAVNEKFSIEDAVELDKNCEGVISVDVNTVVRDIVANSGKISVKGIISLNVFGIKGGDGGSVPFNSYYDIDFTKSFAAENLTPNDYAFGNLILAGVQTKIETDKKLMLDVEIIMQFNGVVYKYTEIQNVVDAISPVQELAFASGNIEQTEVMPQINSVVDVESNINVAGDIGYVSKVLSVDNVNFGAFNVTPVDNKVNIEGIVKASVLAETEEKMLLNFPVEFPVSLFVRAEGIDREHNVLTAVSPVSVNMKARRGQELLIDIRVGVSVIASQTKQIQMLSEIIVGKDKIKDESAVRIYIVGEKDSLWDIAKNTNVSSNEILRQNPQLSSGVIVGDRVIIYRQEVVQF